MSYFMEKVCSIKLYHFIFQATYWVFKRVILGQWINYFYSSRQSTIQVTFMILKIFFVTNFICFYVLLYNDNYRRRWLGNGQTKNIVFVFDATILCPSRKMMEKIWTDDFNYLFIIIEFCVSKILYQKITL